MHRVVPGSIHLRRSELRHQGRFEEAIPLQLEILEAAQRSGRARDISGQWNMLSHLYQMNQQLSKAEEAARQALTTYDNESLEVLATYEMKLATILADQHRFAEAVQYGEVAVIHFSVFHNPPDDFLAAMQDWVESWEPTTE